MCTSPWVLLRAGGVRGKEMDTGSGDWRILPPVATARNPDETCPFSISRGSKFPHLPAPQGRGVHPRKFPALPTWASPAFPLWGHLVQSMASYHALGPGSSSLSPHPHPPTLQANARSPARATGHPALHALRGLAFTPAVAAGHATRAGHLSRTAIGGRGQVPSVRSQARALPRDTSWRLWLAASRRVPEIKAATSPERPPLISCPLGHVSLENLSGPLPPPPRGQETLESP